MQDMVFYDECGNWHAVNVVAISKKYLGIGGRGLCAISICSNVQPQLFKLLHCKLKCNMLQKAVAFFLISFGI